MLIISQSKTKTTEKLEFDIENSKIDDKAIIKLRTEGGELLTFGVYKTKERAKEVLQEIVGLYRRCQQVIGERGGVANFIYPPKVYEMPKE